MTTPSHRADPKRPYKALAAAAAPIVVAAVVAMLNVLLDPGFNLPEWVKLVATVLLAGLATYQIRNPRAADAAPRRVDTDPVL